MESRNAKQSIFYMNLTNNYGLPDSIVNAITNDPYDLDTNDLSKISVTTLISPPKMRMLKARHKDEIEEDVSDQVWKLLGSSVHAMIERAETSDALVEERLEFKIGEKTISGKTDIYKDGEIQDYKVTSVWSIVYSPEGKKEWEEQLNCLAFLYRKAGFEVGSLKIIAILRDWQSSKAKTDPSYPQVPIVQINIPLWTLEAQADYIHLRTSLHVSAESKEDDQIDPCRPEDRWATETKYAVMKNTNKRADKVFDSHNDAGLYILQKQLDADKNSYRVEDRPGTDKRCTEYCSVKSFCHYYKATYNGKERMLEMDV